MADGGIGTARATTAGRTGDATTPAAHPAVLATRAEVASALLRAEGAGATDVALDLLERLGTLVGAAWMDLYRWTDRVMGGAPTWRWCAPPDVGPAHRAAPSHVVVVDDGRSHARLAVGGPPASTWPTGAEAALREGVELLLLTLDRLAVSTATARGEELLRRGVEALDQIVYLYDPTAVRGSYVNQAYERMYDLPRETWFKDPLVFLRRVHPEDRPALVEAIAAAQEANRPGGSGDVEIDVEFRVVAADGSIRWATTRAFPVHDGDGATLMVGITEDITAERELERALTQARLRAEAANRAKSRFLSRMSHELRTPLHAILGYAQLLELGTDDPHRLEQLARVRRAGEHLVALVDDVLDIARIEEGRLSFEPTPVDAGEAVREAVELVEPLVAERHAEVTLALDPAAIAHADRRRLVEVLVNLVSNAVKYGPDRGRVAVRAHRRAERVVLEVSDRGPGFPPADLERAFEAFERLDAPSEVTGAGLGLTLVRALVDGMGGVLEVETQPGAGSTFSVILPAGSEAPSAQAPTPHVLRPGTDRLVLCIEDDPDGARVLLEALGRLERTRALVAARVDVGVALARAHRPDVVLLDLHLPDGTGDDVLARLQAERETKACRVVVVSADATPATRSRLLRAGADAYLTKPLDLMELYRVLGELAPTRRQDTG